MTTGESTAPALVLGPMLRYVSETEVTIWVETDRECLVEILGRGVPTFEVAGHHYGLVVIDGLAPDSEHEYGVVLDDTVRWPLADGGFPPSVLRTLGRDRPVRLAFGSCRVAEIAPKNLSRRARRERARRESAGRPAGEEAADALAATATMLADLPPDRRPDVLLMIGDQVYADEPGPATRRFIADHRAATPGMTAPPREVADFDEYCALYREAWSAPAVRWLLSVIPTAMVFDDHDVHDDWNISGSWRRDYGAKPWWGRRIESAYQSYWVYQHVGNLSPAELATDETWSKVRAQGDAAPALADLAHRADRREPGIRWSFARTFRTTGDTTGGKVRVVMLDSRSRRVVDGTRLMADEAEWRWLTESVAGDWEHVVIATSVPPLLPRGIHTLEAWTEKVCGGAWGRRAARFGEGLRRGFDLEHWPAFGASFTQLEKLLTELATGPRGPHGTLVPRGEPPASVTIISGDVHHSYLAAVNLPRQAAGPTRTSAVYEAVCSPLHQAMPPTMRNAQRLASTGICGLIGAAVAALAGAHAPRIGWRVTAGPWFENMIATLEYDARTATIRFDRAVSDPRGAPRLRAANETRLSS
ncbi:MAG: alkaline phosphatase D family protein [Trebonia sp.]